MKEELLSRYEIVEQIKEHFESTVRQIEEWDKKEAFFMLKNVHGNELQRVLNQLKEAELPNRKPAND
jgi:hypothetical protein